jgi:hypothetical protein
MYIIAMYVSVVKQLLACRSQGSGCSRQHRRLSTLAHWQEGRVYCMLTKSGDSSLLERLGVICDLLHTTCFATSCASCRPQQMPVKVQLLTVSQHKVDLKGALRHLQPQHSMAQHSKSLSTQH